MTTCSTIFFRSSSIRGISVVGSLTSASSLMITTLEGLSGACYCMKTSNDFSLVFSSTPFIATSSSFCCSSSILATSILVFYFSTSFAGVSSSLSFSRCLMLSPNKTFQVFKLSWAISSNLFCKILKDQFLGANLPLCLSSIFFTFSLSKVSMISTNVASLIFLSNIIQLDLQLDHL